MKDKVTDFKFSVNGEQMLTAGFEDRALKVWDARTMNLLHRVDAGVEVMSCDFSPHDSNCVAFVSDFGGMVGAANLRSNKVWKQKHHNNASICDCRFSPAINAAASASHDDTIKLWDIATQNLLATFGGHQCSALSCQFCGCGAVMASASYDNTARVWDVETQKTRCVLSHYAIRACRISNSGNLVVSAGAYGAIKLWDTRTGAVRSFTKQNIHLYCCALHEGTNVVLTEGPEHKINIWDLRTETVAHQLEPNDLSLVPPRQWIVSERLELSPNGCLLARVTPVGTAEVWDLTTKLLLWRKEKTNWVATN